MMSMSGPTASRIAATAASAARTGFMPSMGIVLGTAMLLKAVKPSATACCASSAKRLALSAGVW